MIEIDKKLNITGKGMIPDKLAVKESYREWLESIIGLYQEISHYYKEALSGDGRLIGLEKNELLLKLEMFLHTLLSMIQYLNKNKPQVFIPTGNDTSLLIQYSSASLWIMSGNIDKHRLKEIRNFSDWFNHYFSDALKLFVSTFGESLKDGIINQKEHDQILRDIYPLLIEIVAILVVMQHTEISN